jgi:hypothetical protein
MRRRPRGASTVRDATGATLAAEAWLCFAHSGPCLVFSTKPQVRARHSHGLPTAVHSSPRALSAHFAYRSRSPRL